MVHRCKHHPGGYDPRTRKLQPQTLIEMIRRHSSTLSCTYAPESEHGQRGKILGELYSLSDIGIAMQWDYLSCHTMPSQGTKPQSKLACRFKSFILFSVGCPGFVGWAYVQDKPTFKIRGFRGSRVTHRYGTQFPFAPLWIQFIIYQVYPLLAFSITYSVEVELVNRKQIRFKPWCFILLVVFYRY